MRGDITFEMRDDLLIEEYKDGMPLSLIAMKFDIGQTRIYQILNKHGVKRRSKQTPTINKLKEEKTHMSEDEKVALDAAKLHPVCIACGGKKRKQELLCSECSPTYYAEQEK